MYLNSCPCSGQQNYSVSSYCYVLVVCCLHHFWLVLKFQGSGYVPAACPKNMCSHIYWATNLNGPLPLKVFLQQNDTKNKISWPNQCCPVAQTVHFLKTPRCGQFPCKTWLLLCEILIETSGLQSSPTAIINRSMDRLDCGI